MPYYFLSDGVDDCVFRNSVTQTVTIDEVILDCMITATPAAFDKYVGTASSGFFQRNGSGQDHWNGNWTSVEIDGVPGTNLTNFVPINKRITIRLIGTSTSNSIVVAFANNTAGGGSMPGRLYSVIAKNAGNVVFHYDLTLGHVQDISGNGYHGAALGGTWVDESGGGTTTLTGSGTASGKATVTTSGTSIRKQAAGSSSGKGTASAMSVLTRYGSGTAAGKSTASLAIGAPRFTASGSVSGKAVAAAVPIRRKSSAATASGTSGTQAAPNLRRSVTVSASGVGWTSLQMGGSGGMSRYFYYKRRRLGKSFGLID